MLTKRIIACLDVRDGQVVKGVQFQELRRAGDPGELARRYNVEGIDEVVILDITATLERRQALARTIDAVAREIFLPLTVGGGIRSEEDAEAAIDAGADKVSLKHGGAAESGADHHAGNALRKPGGHCRDRRQACRRSIRGLRPQRHLRCRARCGRVGSRGRVTRCGRDPPDVDGSRRHARWLRLRDDGSRLRRC
jgi:hypothetical protein